MARRSCSSARRAYRSFVTRGTRAVVVLCMALALVACGASQEPGAGGTVEAPNPVWVSPDLPKMRGAVAAPDQPEARDARPSPRPPVEPELLALVSEHPALEGWAPVPLLQLDAPDASLVILWPAFRPDGELTGSDRLLGFVVERQPALRVAGGPVDATYVGPEEVADLLRSSVYEVRERGAGVDLMEVGGRLSDLPQLFAEAVDRGDPAEAIEHAVRLSRVYAPWAIQDNVSETLLLAALGDLRIEHLSTDPEGDRATIHLVLSVPGEPPAEVDLPVRRLPDPGGWFVAEPGPPSPSP